MFSVMGSRHPCWVQLYLLVWLLQRHPCFCPSLSATTLQLNRLIGFPGVKFGGSEHCFVIGTLRGGTGRWCLAFPQGRNFSNKCIYTFGYIYFYPRPMPYFFKWNQLQIFRLDRDSQSPLLILSFCLWCMSKSLYCLGNIGPNAAPISFGGK